MKMPHVCSICNSPIQNEQARFDFPILPAWHAYSKYKGSLHIACLKALPDNGEISQALANLFADFFGPKSATPIIIKSQRILIKDDRKQSKCFDVYDFDNFAVLHVPVHAIEALNKLLPGQKLALGVQQLQFLHRSNEEKMMLEIMKPHFCIELNGLSHHHLMECLLKANAALAN